MVMVPHTAEIQAQTFRRRTSRGHNRHNQESLLGCGLLRSRTLTDPTIHFSCQSRILYRWNPVRMPRDRKRSSVRTMPSIQIITWNMGLSAARTQDIPLCWIHNSNTSPILPVNSWTTCPRAMEDRDTLKQKLFRPPPRWHLLSSALATSLAEEVQCINYHWSQETYLSMFATLMTIT